MTKFLYVATCICSTFILGQDLKGKWTSVISPEEVDEFTLDTKSGDVYKGESYDESYGGEYCNYTFVAKYNESTKEFLGYDKDLIKKTQSHTGVAYRLIYSREGDKEYLTGTGQIIEDNGRLGYPFKAKYMKVTTEKEKPVYQPSAEEIAIIQSYKKKRKNPRKAFIRLPTDKITLKVYDYGQEDDDTISIIFNDHLIAYKTPIDKNIKEYHLELVPGQDNRITFIADNLGNVPPNTSQVEIIADDKSFKYTLFTDLKTNATIDLRLQKK